MRHNRMTVLAVLVACGLSIVSCAITSTLDAGADGRVGLEDTTAVPSELASDDPAADASAADDPARFGDFPSDPSDRWLIAAEYIGTSFVNLATGATLDAGATTVQFGGRSQIAIASSGCGIGGGRFELVDGRVTNPELESDAMACAPQDRSTYEAAQSLINADPEIRVDGNRLLLLSGDHRLEMEASGPGVQPIVEDDERFIGVESTAPGIDPSRIELTSPAFFVIRVTAPTCDLHGSTTTEGEQRTFQIEPPMGHDPCEHSPPADKATRAFFDTAPVATRTGDDLVVTGPQGTIAFRLSSSDDPPLVKEEVVPPPLIVPDQPDRSLPAEAGRPSVPWYGERAGSTGSGQADVPVPEEWEAQDRTVARAAVAGRGYLEVTVVDSGSWDPHAHSDLLQVVDGPDPVTVKLYRQQEGGVVESGTTATADQYRYGSSDPNTWNRLIVWVLERNGTTTIAEVAYPEFPEDSSFANPADTRNRSLTGLDPVDLLADVRFFD